MRVIQAVLGAMGAGVLMGIKYLVAMAVVFAVLITGGMFYLNQHPDLKAELEQKWELIDAVLDSVDPAMIREVGSMLKGEGGSAVVEAAPAEYDYDPHSSIPESLYPMYEVLQQIKDPDQRSQYIDLITVAQAGEFGEGALPLLEVSLKDGSPSLKDAARKSLNMIGTAEARALLARHGGQ